MNFFDTLRKDRAYL